MLLHWFLCFWGNLAGALFVMAIIMGCKCAEPRPPESLEANCLTDGGVFDSGPYRTRAVEFVVDKQVKPQFHQIFLRGIGCNWLVCLACYLVMQGKDLNSKIVAMWGPIFTFVSLGLDHGMFPRLGA